MLLYLSTSTSYRCSRLSSLDVCSSFWLSLLSCCYPSKFFIVIDATQGHGRCNHQDPYIYLEEVESEESLQFARLANEKCLEALGDPTKSGTGTYERVLAVLESKDRIPYATKFSRDDNNDDILYNFWQDGNVCCG